MRTRGMDQRAAAEEEGGPSFQTPLRPVADNDGDPPVPNAPPRIAPAARKRRIMPESMKSRSSSRRLEGILTRLDNHHADEAAALEGVVHATNPLLSDDTTCSICYRQCSPYVYCAVHGGVVTETCSAIFCSDCKDRVDELRSCPMCTRRVSDMIRVLPLESAFSKRVVPCDFCQREVYFEDLVRHTERTCPKAFPCAFGLCKKVFSTLDELNMHLASNHSPRMAGSVRGCVQARLARFNTRDIALVTLIFNPIQKGSVWVYLRWMESPSPSAVNKDPWTVFNTDILDMSGYVVIPPNRQRQHHKGSINYEIHVTTTGGCSDDAHQEVDGVGGRAGWTKLGPLCDNFPPKVVPCQDGQYNLHTPAALLNLEMKMIGHGLGRQAPRPLGREDSENAAPNSPTDTEESSDMDREVSEEMLNGRGVGLLVDTLYTTEITGI